MGLFVKLQERVTWSGIYQGLFTTWANRADQLRVVKDGGDLGAAREACPGGVLSAFGQPMTDDSQPPVQQAFRVPKAPLLDPSNAFPIFVSLPFSGLAWRFKLGTPRRFGFCGVRM